MCDVCIISVQFSSDWDVGNISLATLFLLDVKEAQVIAPNEQLLQSLLLLGRSQTPKSRHQERNFFILIRPVLSFILFSKRRVMSAGLANRSLLEIALKLLA